ncbi:hypothetical protein Tco_0754918, partial [Tanacetum coccineum]
IIMLNVFPPDHVNDLPEVEPNQPESALVDENEELEEEEEELKDEDEFEEEEPQELLLLQDECVVERRRMHWSKRKGRQRISIMVRLIADLGNEVRCSVGKREVVLEDLIKEFGNAKERVKCKKLKKELEEARSSNTLLSIQKERFERDLYWTRVQAHEFYQEMIRREFVFEERPNEAIDVPVEDKESPSSKPRGSFRDSYIDAAIVAERARHANAGNNASRSGPARGQVTAPVVRECTFARFMKCNPDNLCGTEGAVELRRWFEKMEMTFGISEYAEYKKVKFAAVTL